MQFVITGKNAFHSGWLACFLGLPCEQPGCLDLSSDVAEFFVEGWDTCQETGAQLSRVAYERMRELGQVRLEVKHEC